MSVTIMLKSGQQVKLGRIRPDFKPMCLDLGNYFDAAEAAALPDKVDWATKAKSSLDRMYLNDKYGCCVVAGKYHQVGVWSGNDTPTAVVGTDQEVYSHYQQICGPGDNGCIITRVLDYMKANGLKFNGVPHKIDGYVKADWTNKDLVKTGIYLFGGGTIGVNLPQSWTCTDCVWDVTNSQIVGGHDVCICGYDTKGVQVSTWGGVATITWNAFLSRKYVEELYFMLGPDWYNNDKLAPNGIDVTKLKTDLQSVGGGAVPPINDPTPPTPGTSFNGAVRYEYANGVVSNITLFKK